MINSCELYGWKAKPTGVWTAKQAGPHADVSVPVNGMKADESCNERRIEIVNSFNVFIHVASKILQYTSYSQYLRQKKRINVPNKELRSLANRNFCYNNMAPYILLFYKP